MSWGLWQGVLTGWLGIGSLVHHGGLAQRFGQVLPVPHIGLQLKYLGGVVAHHADPRRVAASGHQLCKGWKAARAHQSCSRPRKSLQPHGIQHLKACSAPHAQAFSGEGCPGAPRHEKDLPYARIGAVHHLGRKPLARGVTPPLNAQALTAHGADGVGCRGCQNRIELAKG